MRTAAGDLPPFPNLTLHGDLHGGNVILGDDGPVLVGLDTPALGDPAFDLALLGTSLFVAAIQSGTAVTRTATLIEELPAAYAEVTGAPVRGDTYAWHVASALVGWQADAALQVLAPHADALTAALLDTAMAVLRDGAQTAALTSFVG
jgi:aminoglycoside phosphotransferase (APT) family kinase protein